MTVTEEQSAEMVAGYCADPKAYFKAHAVNDFLPPLAPSIMERLQRGFGSVEEIDYYDCTLQCHEDLNAHHRAEKAAAKSPVQSLKKFGDADDDDLPF